MAEFKDDAHRNKIIDRIRKMIALANGTTFDGEADTAMTMAKNLMSSYGLHMSEVELKSEINASIGTGHVSRVGRLHTWEKLLANAAAELCDTRVIVTPVGDLYTLMFVGMKQDVELAVMFYEEFALKIKQMAVTKYAVLYERYRYLEGITARLVDRANEISEQTRNQRPTYGALVVVKDNEIQEFMDREIGKTRNAKLNTRENNESFMRGYIDGGNIDLNVHKKLEG